MRKTLRTALIWILMLALPAQAMAALGMQLCEQVHRSGAQQMSGGEHDEHGMHHDMAADSAHQDVAPATAGELPADGSLCTLCAFCVGAVAPGQPLLGDASLHAVEPAIAWPDRLVATVSDTPERPPRFVLA